jgi:c(7)-type cytochrome triheme protein
MNGNLRKGGETVGNKFWRILIVSICIICFATLGVAFAQKKVGGGDIKYESKTAGTVLFSHETHVNTHKTKCTDCHSKVFKMKKEAKITKADHSETKYCTVCHDGKKAFGSTVEADCAKCHKK